MAGILSVRIKSEVDAEEFECRVLERRPRLREVPGWYRRSRGRDDATGDLCGIYFFESSETPAADLAGSIPSAREAVDLRREAYEVLYPLWPERGGVHRHRSPGGRARQSA
jgi:hypothetical protein